MSSRENKIMLPAKAIETASSSSLPNQICQRFSIDEILSATKNFDDSLVIGRGGFGKVYKGPIKVLSITINAAIKRLHSMSNQGAPEFWAEVETLSQLRHCNLVSLIGYCNERQEMVLVYEYMPHGTLEHLLYKATTPLSWLQRLKICIGAARGLDYLHTGTGTQHGVIHRDVKSSNILLDENFAAKISDFGLAKIGPINQTRTHISTRVKGTFGYIDPCYFYTGKLTRKSDVYAFGVVLSEVLCGRPAVDDTLDEGQWGLATWAQDRIKDGKLSQIVDKRLRDQISASSLKEFARIVVRCLHKYPNQRPTMTEVVARLQLVLSLQERMDSSAVQWTFLEKFRLIFSTKLKSSVIGEESISTVAIKGEAKVEGDSCEGAPQIIHFDDASSFSVEDVLCSDAELISMGNYWSTYRIILKDGNQFLVKRKKGVFSKDFETAIAVLGKIRHDHILTLKAYYLSRDKNFLISEYIQKGSVERVLHSLGDQVLNRAFGWETRLNIIMGITRGLVYLHTQENIVHGNLTSRNVLLDHDNNPLIADVGHSRLIAGANPDIVRDQHAPELLKFENANKETDVYSLGLIILELLTRKSPHTNMNGLVRTVGLDLPSWVKSIEKEEWINAVIDVELLTEASVKEELVRVLELGMVCVRRSPKARPKAEEVLQQLEEIVATTANYGLT